MRMLLSRPLLSRTLLWALLLNMALGMVAHQALHRHAGSATPRGVMAMEALRSAAAEPTSGARQPTPAEAPDPTADDLCLGCHALSQLAAAAAPPPTPAHLLPLAAPQAPPGPPRDTVLPSPGRWRFASRDPPAWG